MKIKPAQSVLVILMLSSSAVVANDIFSGWQARHCGANIYSGNPDFDLQAAKTYGMRVVRLGATGDQNDFRYLVGKDGDWDFSKANLNRLKEEIHRFSKYGLQVVLTLSHVPGRFWQEGKRDIRIFQDRKYQETFFSAWKTIATTLLDEQNIVGYDLINEPLLPEEMGQDTSAIDYETLGHKIKGTPSDINEFYQKTISAIREVDSKTPIILEETGTGDFSSIVIIKPKSDPFILYSFHYYEPYAYYRGKSNGQLRYPGSIPIGGSYWDRDRHRANFEKVEAWRNKSFKPLSALCRRAWGLERRSRCRNLFEGCY